MMRQMRAQNVALTQQQSQQHQHQLHQLQQPPPQPQQPPPTPLTPNEEAHRAVSGALADALRDPQADAALFQRLCSRPELTVVLMTPREISALTPAQTQAWGAGGLRPAELRALHLVLQRTPPRGAGASGLQFVRQVAARVSELPASLPGAGMGGGEGVTTI